jgi:hypothetical protein
MPLEPVQIWKQTFAKLPKTDKSDWASNVARWLGERTTGKLQLAPTVVGPVMFSFQVGVCESQLKSCNEVDKSQLGAVQYARALESAIMASTMTVTPGCYLGAPAPPTTWSAVTSFIDPPSVQLAKVQLIQGLTSASGVDEGMRSSVAAAFYSAIKKLTCTATGISSSVPPVPLLSPFTPVG